ncbi:GATA zinc finger domain-containing protein 1 [Blattella germanica]|nr:GATA zinc finger domain-containing protein 1 [Blattella germanica]
MPFGVKPECIKCQRTECSMWKNTPEGKICNECMVAIEKANAIKVEESSTTCKSPATDSGGPKIATRKSARNTRSYKTRLNPYALPKPVAPKGKGRRVIFKKSGSYFQLGDIVSMRDVEGGLFYAQIRGFLTDQYCEKSCGSYFQLGDIVSMRDVEGGLFYAQIRGFLTDQYCEKSCVITWLLPTQASPEEDIPRKLECMEFVMHAPSDYFKARNTPFPPMHLDGSESNFIWTRLTPQMRSA